ncbi:MAG TPA: hypothetical protein VHA79_12070 [Mycobacteriales bacterium]|jgi:hypothetical protein|nr:hypothetical protein [Mycobacteriales bacterium]
MKSESALATGVVKFTVPSGAGGAQPAAKGLTAAPSVLTFNVRTGEFG